MTDMQKNIRTLLNEGIGKKAVLLYIFAAVIVLTEMIMYYAAGLTLNTLFAGIGNMFVSLIALACALGAAAGIFLFTSIADTIRLETEEQCMDTLEQNLMQEEQNEEMLYPLIEDAVHFQFEGIIHSRSLLIQDVIRIIAVTALDFRCGLILTAGFIVYELLYKKYAEKKIVSARKFVMDLHLILGVLLSALLCAVLIFALYEMYKGRMGLYGVIMVLFMFMDMIRSHAKHTDTILHLRKDLRSLEILDAYRTGTEQLPEVLPEETVCDEKKTYVLLGLSFLALTLCAIMYVSAIRNVLDYRTSLSLNAACALMMCAALIAPVCFAYGKALMAKRKADVILRKSASAIVSVIALIAALRTNALLGGILASAFAAVQILVPLIMSRRSVQEDSGCDHIRGLVHMISLSLIIIAGVLLYWNAMASFGEVLLISVLYMVTYMHIDTMPLGSGKEEIADEQ